MVRVVPTPAVFYSFSPRSSEHIQGIVTVPKPKRMNTKAVKKNGEQSVVLPAIEYGKPEGGHKLF